MTRSLTTITCSDGQNKEVETTAVSVLAWLATQSKFSANIQKAINWLVSQVKMGKYGSTQGTILSLKAITTYMSNFVSINGNGNFVLRINDTVVQTISFTPEKKDSISFNFDTIRANNEFSKFFVPGQTLNLKISLENFVLASGQSEDFKVSYAFAFNYYDSTPLATSSNLAFSVSQSIENSLLGK